MPFNFGHVVALLMIIVLVLTAVGTAGPQFSQKSDVLPTVNCNRQYFLYQSRDSCSGQDATTRSYSRSEFACKSSYDKLTTAYAFAIISCIIAFFAIIAALVTAFVPRVPSAIAAALVIFTFICLTVAWPISESVRSLKQCDESSSYKDAGYKIDWGLALLITAWCLSFVVALLALIFGCCPSCTRPVVVVKKDTETHRVSEPVAVAHATV